MTEKLRTNKKIQKETQHQGFFPIRTITTTRTISIQNAHESSRIKLLVVITSVVKPLPDLLPGDRVGVCELRLGGCAWRGGWEPQKIKPAVRHTDCKPEEVEILYHNVLEKGEAKEKTLKTSSLLLGCIMMLPSFKVALTQPSISQPSTPRGLQYPRAGCRSRKHRHTPGFGTAALEEPEFFTRTITSRSQAEVTGSCSRKLTYPTKRVPRQISRGYVIVPWRVTSHVACFFDKMSSYAKTTFESGSIHPSLCGWCQWCSTTFLDVLRETFQKKNDPSSIPLVEWKSSSKH